MSDSSALPKSCPKCGAELSSEATDGLCPKCLMGEAMQPTIVSDASKPRVHSAILAPEELAPFFPQYEILRMLGRGGMGAVYLARQISLNRLVAIKVLPADLGESDRGFAERFKNEAQAMAQLSHPGIVAVFDFGQTTNGLLYIVMEYIEGTDVQLMITSQGRLHSAHAMAITAHVCDALQYAHSCGIIHRDIKPSNIMVGNNGVVKVADFGLAKMSQGQTTGLTQSGMAMGTLHFMAPEALTLGSAVDQRADIYAVGVMLYQMLTGKLPQGMFEMPSFQVPGLDPRYDRIVAKALRDDREVRYQAAADLRHDLDAILTQPVEKIAPEAETEVKALPPVEQRGKKKARVPSLPPQAASPAPVGKRPVGLILVVLGAAAALVSAFVYFRDHGSGTTIQPELATKEQPFVNSLGMRFVPIPITGGPTDKQRVLFSIWQTRVQDYEVFVKETEREWPKPSFEQDPAHPAININWVDAKAFCSWMTDHERKAGRLGANEVYRLPSDHEWSCAAGIGEYEDAKKLPTVKSGQIPGFSWGSRATPPDHFGNFADTAFHEKFPDEPWVEGYSDGYATTSPVGSFQANARGLYDMSGNVWQWCEDFTEVSANRHVMRGCAFSGGRFVLSFRKSDPATERYDHGDFGFRCVIAPADTTSFPVSPSAAAATKDAPFINTLGMKFVPVPITGGPTDKQRVLFSIWETRVQDYETFAKETKRKWSLPPFAQEPGHPTTNVSWDDAHAFCVWLTEREHKTGKLGTNEIYRLPSDHEWSCAVGIGAYEDAAKLPSEKNNKIKDIYPWGTQWPPSDNTGNYASEELKPLLASGKFTGYVRDVLHGYRDGYASTSPVGSYAANQFGLYDMGGNVWEWCEDWNDKDQNSRVIRGAAWNLYQAPSSNRYWNAPDRGIYNNGYRCVLASTAEVSSSPGHPVSPSSTAATKESPFTNTLGMQFVPVPITGGPTDGKRVLFSIWETRVQDYEVFVKQTKHEWQKPNFGQEATHPVVNVSWDDAQAFCTWLTERERKAGKLGANERYRLPHDHEWSCAVGIGDREDPAKTPQQKHNQIIDLYPWGTAWPPPQGAGNYADESAKARQNNASFQFISGYDDGFAWTAPVGSFAANPFGLYDLGGNAHELSEDRWQPDQPKRTGRGGSYSMASPRRLLQLSDRSNDDPSFRIMDRGFRCVLESSAPAAAAPPKLPDSKSPTSTTTKDAPFINTLGMKFVPVPIIGGPTDKQRVLFSIWETRVQDYAVFAKETQREWPKPPFEQGPTHPAVNVTWDDAQAFCLWLTARERKAGKLGANVGYRLPTDHEWSCAVGIGEREDPARTPKQKDKQINDVFPWGGAWPPPSGAGNYCGEEAAGHEALFRIRGILPGYRDNFPATAPVGSFAANPHGLFDLSGNATEWCADVWMTDDSRVVRGGCYDEATRNGLLSSARNGKLPGGRYRSDGFRIVLASTADVSSSPSLPVSPSSTAATKESPFANTLGMKFVPVPITGGPTNGQRVLFSVWETRVQDYEVFVKETKREWEKPDFAQGPAHPVVLMNYDDAQAFCVWLTDREHKAGKISTNEVYRLPSDHEWSCVAGIGEREDAAKTPAEKSLKIKRVFTWGDAWPPPEMAGNYAGEELRTKIASGVYRIPGVMDGYRDGFVETSPVGSFHADHFGLCDLGGNVWEWCGDWFDTERSMRVLRGASWLNSDLFQVPLSNRGRMSPELRNLNNGFRVVLAPTP